MDGIVGEKTAVSNLRWEGGMGLILLLFRRLLWVSGKRRLEVYGYVDESEVVKKRTSALIWKNQVCQAALK